MAADPDATQRVSGAPSGNVVPGGASREGVAGAASGTFDRDATQRVLPSSVEAVLTSGQRVFGRYTLEAEVGRGGMGVVWRAHDEELRETVALKFLPTAVARDAAAVDELKEETRRARRLTHPNIVRIHDFVRDAALAAVSMEFVDGQTLSHLRLKQPGKVFSAEALAPIVNQLCAALDYAHEQAKIVHRDLKPANILVTRKGVVKIADFGIARSLTETQTRLTGVGDAVSGTLLYMSPQQVLGRKPTVADDIYALGATLYELLTTKPPFHRGDPYSLMMQIRDSIPLTLAEQCSELEVAGTAIPREWEKAILACLAKEPTQRPASIHEFATRLAQRESFRQANPLAAVEPSAHDRLPSEPPVLGASVGPKPKPGARIKSPGSVVLHRRPRLETDGSESMLDAEMADADASTVRPQLKVVERQGFVGWLKEHLGLAPEADESNVVGNSDSDSQTPSDSLVTPDSVLAAVVGSKPMSRTELTKKIWAYIKKNGLQDSRVKTMINADYKLQAVFEGKKSVSMFEMTKLVSKHVRK